MGRPAMIEGVVPVFFTCADDWIEVCLTGPGNIKANAALLWLEEPQYRALSSHNTKIGSERLELPWFLGWLLKSCFDPWQIKPSSGESNVLAKAW
jgi:hypothetical protein